ncbi:MAG: glycerol-3-phosphate 1-O-acyltransferase PlsY [Magnetococcales bacterium]|nr:glycerol-3-phosphate 1-O-acyltransferase PlsY [Magnetococcales bacterium]
MSDPIAVVVVVAAYLIGAIPFGLLVARFFGAGDIRQQGSGNIGATNVLRAAGKKAGATALLLDMFKGALPLFISMSLYGANDPITLYCALAAFSGHLYPIYLGFKGGKGVATALGILLAWVPLVGLITVLLWLLGAKLFKISSLAALIAFALLPPMLYLFGESLPLWASAYVTPLIFWRHRANINRLLRGEEPRIGKKSEVS